MYVIINIKTEQIVKSYKGTYRNMERAYKYAYYLHVKSANTCRYLVAHIDDNTPKEDIKAACVRAGYRY